MFLFYQQQPFWSPMEEHLKFIRGGVWNRTNSIVSRLFVCSCSVPVLLLVIRPLVGCWCLRHGSRPRLRIKALLVSWLTLHRTHKRTHPPHWQVLQLLVYCPAWFLAGKLKDSLRGHLTDEARLAHTHSCTLVGRSWCCFVLRLMDEGRLVIGLKCFTVLAEGVCVGGSVFFHRSSQQLWKLALAPMDGAKWREDSPSNAPQRHKHQKTFDFLIEF